MPVTMFYIEPEESQIREVSFTSVAEFTTYILEWDIYTDCTLVEVTINY